MKVGDMVWDRSIFMKAIVLKVWKVSGVDVFYFGINGGRRNKLPYKYFDVISEGDIS